MEASTVRLPPWRQGLCRQQGLVVALSKPTTHEAGRRARAKQLLLSPNTVRGGAGRGGGGVEHRSGARSLGPTFHSSPEHRASGMTQASSNSHR